MERSLLMAKQVSEFNMNVVIRFSTIQVSVT
jgi:hypothetical protein